MIGLVREIRNRGVAVLIIEHAMRVIMGLSDRITVLNYGQCICEGDKDTVCTDPGVIQAYLGNADAVAKRG